MAIVPDDKDWTWVLDKPCEECGFDTGAFVFSDVPRLVRGNVKQWVQVFEDQAETLAVRADEDVWSTLEYAAHVADVFRIMLARLNLMVVLEDPEFLNWDQDVTAVAHKYAKQKPEVVQRTLVHAGTAFAAAVEDVPLGEVARRGHRSNGSEFTIRTLASYALHDLVHHVWDVTGERFSA